MTISNYLLEFSIFITLVYAGYKLILSNHNSLHFNRMYLLSGLVFALIIPFLTFSVNNSETYSDIIRILPTIDINPGNNKQILTAVQHHNTFNFQKIILLTIYFTGVAIILLKTIRNLKQIENTIKNSGKTRKFGINIYTSKECNSAFNFFNIIVIPEKILNSKQLRQILTHEDVHRQQWHTADKILMEIMQIVFWFHPVVWLYGKVISQNHEFLADQGVINTGHNSQLYAKFLAGFAYSRQLSPSSQFNQSLTLKRLAMIKKTSKAQVAYIKITLLLAILITTGIFQACETTEKEDINNETTNAAVTQKQVKGTKIELLTTDNKSIEAEIDQIEEIGEIIAKNGAIKSIKLTQDNSEAYTIVEKMPEFPGGKIGLAEFLSKTIHYPEIAKESNIEGKVYIQFTISKEGEVTYAEVVRGVAPELDNEALRAVLMMPKWIPGEEKGNKIGVSFTVPINFKLS